MCGISWPTKYKVCPVCGGAADYISNEMPSPDWEESLAQALQTADPELITAAVPSRVARNVEDMRFKRFTDAGLDVARAMVCASDKTMDTHKFEHMVEKMVAKGYTHEQALDLAYDILS
jgi:hypothetical protein